MRRATVFLGCMLLLLIGCARQESRVQTYCGVAPYEPVVTSLPAAATGLTPKNVILMIGDGMSLHHVGAAWVANRGRLNLDACPYIGLSRTYCQDTLITDSGAGGTALATGQKTRKAHIATNADGEPIPSLITYAREAGMRTGVSVVCRLCDATPADFCSHTDNRDLYDTINAGYLYSGADFIAGGGHYFWTRRADGRNIEQEMVDRGYNLVRTPEELFAADCLPVLAMLADSEYVASPMRGDLFPRQSLHAVRLLDNSEGFFLMVEGSCIDDYSHANDLPTVIEEVLDFDRTVGEVLRWAAEDGETLVVITADHETGGLTLLGGAIERGEITCQFANDSHSGVLVPIYAYGPGAERFTGILENSELGQRLIRLITHN